MANGWLTNNPLAKHKIKIKEVIREVLTEEELDRLMSKHFPHERLSITRDVFVFCCFTGLSYIDVKKLKRSMICTGMDGEQWIFTSRQKSKEPSRVPLLPKALEIFGRYQDHVICKYKNVALPVNTNQKMNAYLKEIAAICDKGKLNKEDKQTESTKEFKQLRHAHSAVESNINMLEHHGLNRCMDKGLHGYKRCVGVSVLAYNLHQLGNILLLKQRELEDRKQAALLRAA